MSGLFSRLIDRFGIGLLILTALMTLVPGTFDIPLLDRDEPRFSQATAEMMDRQDWVVPYFNGEYRFDKPPLTYWWMRVHYWIFGKSEIGARLHSVWSTLLVAVGMFLLGRKWFNKETAWLASFAWLTCFQIFQHGRLALADMPMVAAIFYSMWAIYELLEGEDDDPDVVQSGKGRWKWYWILYGSLGLGFLAKGPIALATPLFGAMLYQAICWRTTVRRFKERSVGDHLRTSWRLLLGCSIVLVMVGAWGIPALIMTDGLFWDIGMGKHVIDRGIESFNERPVIPAYYFVTAFFSLFPWFGFFGKRLWNIRSGWDKRSAFLVSWIISPYVIFLFYSTQLPHYVMPAFPALFLWIMASVCKTEWKWGWLGNIWFWTYAVLFEILFLGGLIWLLGSDFSILPLKWGMASIFVLLLCLNAIALAVRFRAYYLTVPFLVLIALFQLILGANMRKVSPVIPIAKIIEGLPENSRLVGVGFEEPSLVFYTGRVWDFHVDREDLVEDLNSEAGKRSCYVLLQHEQIIDQMVSESWGAAPAEYRNELGIDLEAQASDTHVILDIDGVNFARMRWAEITVLFPKDPLDASS